MSSTDLEAQHSDFDLPNGWVEAKLGAVYKLEYGKGLTKTARNTDGKYPVFGSNGVVDHHDAYLVEGPVIVVGRKGAAGALSFSKKPCWPIDTTYYVCESEHIDIEFSFYLFSSFRLNQFDRSTAIPGLNRDDAYDVIVRLPPLPEQRRIVAKIEELFSELDKGIESLKTARRQLEVYRQSILKHAFEGKLTAQWREENKDKLEKPQELLARVKKVHAARYEQEFQEWKRAVKTWEAEGKRGKRPPKPGKVKPQTEMPPEEVERLPSVPKGWCFVRLCQVAEVGSGMSVSATRKLEDSLNVPYLRVANVQRGFLDLTEVKHMTIERSQLESLQLKQWDVLFNEGGDRDKLGRGWIWQSEITPCITQNHVFRASPYLASEFNSKLLSFWANTFGQRYFDKAGKQTTNLASINKTVLSQFPVPLIPYAEQEEICTQIDRSMMSLDAQEREIARALGMADLLRQSILEKAFSGHLVAQDASDEPASVLLEKIKTERAKAGKPGPTARKNRKANTAA